MTRLADIAPRLALARDQWVAEQAERERRIRYVQNELFRAERCLAHRELQLIRAAAIGNAKYLRHRQRKLEDIQRKIKQLKREAARG